ncbi:right-handed parallel beta-helix repeat-containing protein, partial [Methanobacterium petrolearium]
MHKGIKLATIIAFLLLSCATISAVSAANIYTITDDSYTNYFNASGYINDTNIISGDVLDCSGAINNKDMYIDRPLNITSSDKTGTIFNGTITILSSGSGTNVTDLVINNTNHNGNIAPGSIVIAESENNTIANNVVLTSQEGDDSYGVCLIEANNNQINGNTITTTGDGTGSAKKGDGKFTYGVYLEESSSNVFDSNTITTTGVSADVDWSDWLNGGVYPTTGVFLYSASDNNDFINNTINTDYNLIHSTTGYDTLLGVRIHQESCGNNFANNTINTNGFSYAYGVEIVGTYGCLTSSGNIISGNTISTVGDNYANGIKVSTYTEDTLVSGNDISATADNFAYGVYLENFGGSEGLKNVTVTGNNVLASADESYVLELYEARGHTITDNVFNGVGEDGCYGIHLMSASNSNNISGNNVTVNGDGITYGVYLEDSSSNIVDSNIVNTTGFAGDVDWSPYPDPGIYSTIGVFLYDSSNNNILTNNIINTDYNAISASGFDTMLGVRLCEDCNGNNLTGNTINTNGYSYGYGLEIVGAFGAVSEGNIISGNDISTVGKNYANGVKVSGYTKDTVISENDISAIADNFAYGLYLEDYGNNLQNVTATGNNVFASAIQAYVLDLYRATGHTILNNIFNGVGGDECYGIHLVESNANNLSGNNVTVNGDGITYGVYLDGSSSNVFDLNTIHTTGLAGDIDWSDYYMGGIYPTLGVFISNGSAQNNLTNNNITTDYNNISESGYDTILGVQIRNDCDENTLSGNIINTIGNNYAYGLEVVGGFDSSTYEYLECEGNVISDNTINTVGENHYANGIKVGAITPYTQISGNNVSATAPDLAYGIYLEGGFLGPLRYVSVNDNIIQTAANINYIIELYSASGSNLANGNQITNNMLTGVGNYTLGISTYQTKYNTITNNTITITGNNTAEHIPNGEAIPEGNDGIKLYYNSNNNIVNGNIINGSIVSGTDSSSGIHLHRSTGNTLEANTIDANSNFTNGMFLQNNSNENVVTNNIISGNVFAGIFVNGSSNNEINNNNILGNQGNGISVNASDNNTITNNDINNNGEDGINVEQSTGNGITDNEIYENQGKGISTTNAEDNTHENNNIHDNGESVEVNSADPANNAVNVPCNKVINITFSDSIKAVNMSIQLTNSGGTVIPTTTAINNNILTITPTTLLIKGTQYILTLNAGSITDLVGNPLASYTSVFTATTDSTVPKPTAGSPARNAVNVAVSRVITTTFNEDIVVANAAGVRLVSSSGTVVPVTVSVSGKVLSVTPTSALNRAT